MADMFEELTGKHIKFIENQKIFFVGTAGAKGLVNVSPKGMDSFRILNDSRIAWVNFTGSGNESAAHVLENRRMTIMFCSFDKHPLILRLYGNAAAVHTRDQKWEKLAALFPSNIGARQIFELDVELVQTSCGYAVPYFQFDGERPTLTKWAEKKGKTGIEEYWQENNMKSLDGARTGILDST